MGGRILVAEDDERMRELLEDYFSAAGYTVVSAKDGVEAMTCFEREPPDVALLDIMMPGMDGWSVCRRIRQRGDTPIVILSARSEEDDKLMGFELGADEYVTKPFSPRVLVAAVSALLRRMRRTDPGCHPIMTDTERDVTEVGLPTRGSDPHSAATTPLRDEKPGEGCLLSGGILLDRVRYRVSVHGNDISLTTREFELLGLMMQHEGRVFRRDDLILSIWGYEYVGDGRVVDTNVKMLRKKLGAAGRHIQTVIGVGYRFEETVPVKVGEES